MMEPLSKLFPSAVTLPRLRVRHPGRVVRIVRRIVIRIRRRIVVERILSRIEIRILNSLRGLVVWRGAQFSVVFVLDVVLVLFVCLDEVHFLLRLRFYSGNILVETFILFVIFFHFRFNIWRQIRFKRLGNKLSCFHFIGDFILKYNNINVKWDQYVKGFLWKHIKINRSNGFTKIGK